MVAEEQLEAMKTSGMLETADMQILEREARDMILEKAWGRVAKEVMEVKVDSIILGREKRKVATVCLGKGMVLLILGKGKGNF